MFTEQQRDAAFKNTNMVFIIKRKSINRGLEVSLNADN